MFRKKEVKKVIVCTGAGISTSAGIPDFRTPGTGLYSNLEKYNLPYPEAVFDINYFRGNPAAFYTLSTELLPGQYPPTLGHHFIKLLQDEGILLRCYSQNIDGLDRLAGVEDEKLVEAHGSFATSRCIKCKSEVDNESILPALRAGTPMECVHCDRIGKTSYIKPDIVFFGESLPERFHRLTFTDFAECDLLIVIGTSLQVYPFAGLPDMVGKDCPRILINRELVGSFQNKRRKRDAFYCGNADDGCLLLADALGKRQDVITNQKRLAADIQASKIATKAKDVPTESKGAKSSKQKKKKNSKK